MKQMKKNIDYKLDEYFNSLYEVSSPISSYNNVCQCGNDDIIDDIKNGIQICNTCGLVQNIIIEEGSEYNQYDDDIGRFNTFSNPFLSKTTSSYVSFGKDKILKKIHLWLSMEYHDRSLTKEFKKIQDICENNNIPLAVIQCSMNLYNIVSGYKPKNNKYIITRGKNHIGINAGCLFLSCYKKNFHRTIKEIAKMYNIDENTLSNGVKQVRNILKKCNYDLDLSICKSENYIKRVCDELGILTIYTNFAIQISRNIEILEKNNLLIASNHTPFSLCAAIILITVEKNNIEDINKKIISQKFDISEVTIMKTYKKLKQFEKLLLSKNIEKELLTYNINNNVNDKSWLNEIKILDIPNFEEDLSSNGITEDSENSLKNY